jgi:hypothetical protein
VEWQLNVDPSMLRNFQHCVQQVLAEPRLYPPQFPLNAVHAPGVSKSIAEPELDLALLELCPPYYIFPDINHFLAGPNSGRHDSNSNWTVDVTHPGSSHSLPTYTLTLEQQHITIVEEIVPTLQNIVATVNIDCRLDLKTITLHACNAEYNPKVGTTD